MCATVFRGYHLHAEICQREGHLDTGLFPVEHINILSRGSDTLGLQAVGEDPVVLVLDPFGIERPRAYRREGFNLRREVLEHGVERAVVEETLLIRVARRVGVGDWGAAGLHETVVEEYHAGSGLETRVQPIEPAVQILEGNVTPPASSKGAIECPAFKTVERVGVNECLVDARR
jgi:hypothetical protein